MVRRIGKPKMIKAKPLSGWGPRTWLFLLVSVCAIAPLSLFVHDYMLETLKVPYPKTPGLPVSVEFFDELIRLSAVAFLCRLACPQLWDLTRLQAALLAGLLVIMLNETLRVFVIESAILGNATYAALDIAPRAVSLFAGGCAVAWVALGGYNRRNIAIAVILISALEVFALHPALDAAGSALTHILPEPRPLYSDPYPFKINLIIYVTFLEPTIAAFAIVSVCWPALGDGTLRRILTFAALLLFVRGRFFALFIESFWVRQKLPTAFLSESQFFLETLVLGVLVALGWSMARRIEDSQRG